VYHRRNHKSVFRVNTAEGYEALNLKSNGKNKYNIILSIGEDKVTKDATEALFKKHPDTSIIATLDEQGKLVFPHGEAFTKCLVFTTHQGSTIQIGVSVFHWRRQGH
jgi:hypothetical protein